MEHVEAVVESSDRFRSAFDGAAVGLAMADLDGRILEVNGRFAAILGTTPAALRGRSVVELTHPDDRAPTRANMQRLLAGSASEYSLEKRYVRNDGSVVWSHTTVSLQRAGDGRPSHFVGSILDVSERRAEQSRLQESAQRLELALAAGGLGDWSWDAASDVVDFGPGAATVFGTGTGPVTTWSDLRGMLHPDDREAARLAVAESLESRRDYDIEYRVRRADGEERWVAALGRPRYAPDGTVAGMTGVVRDVTDRKRVEEALREETRVLDILNRTGRAIASTLDLQSLLQLVTDSATELTGAAFGAFFYNTHDERGEAFLLYTLSGAPRSAFERFGHPRATPLFGPTFHGTPAIRIDDVLADPRYGQLRPHHGMPPGHLPVRSYLAVAVTGRGGEVFGGLFFGHPRPAMFNERSERLACGVAAHAAVAIDNARLYEAQRNAAAEREHLLDAERAARSQAEKIGRIKDEFLATLSHELRTPLNAILGWSQILLGGKTGEAERERGLEVIARNARAQTQLIEDLLDMSRIVSGKVRLDTRRADLTATINAAVDSVRPAAAARGVELRLALDPHAPTVVGDPHRLQQIVWNLLTNAIKFTPRGGHVDVVLRAAPDSVELAVADDGIGIDGDFLPHVFDRFRQADASTTREHGGLGLGLSIVRQLVEMHGGSIAAESGGRGRGATFTVRLPAAAANAAVEGTRGAGARREPDSGWIDLRGLRVLVVDDEPDARELLRVLLSDARAEVATAGGVEQALAVVAEELPNVIVSDIGMPGRDGYQLMQAIRALPADKGGGTPAIALTAFARSEDRTRALQAGYQLHLSKPVDPQELLASLARLARAPT
jgi:PAS domain S-box-containing protein